MSSENRDTTGCEVPHLLLRGERLPLPRTMIMGVVNATLDSFSDAGLYRTTEARLERVDELIEAGAAIIDIGGQSGVTGVSELDPAEEITRVVPLIEAIVERHPSQIISIDTYKPRVVEAALAAGASIVNDTSGLLYPEVASIAADAAASLVIMHNRSLPKQRVTEPTMYTNVVEDVRSFLDEKANIAIGRGASPESLIFDPGPDFSKTPYQTVEILRHLDECMPPGRPRLLAISRKDFIGAITRTGPTERLAGTLAALGYVRGPGVIVRVHDVLAAQRFLAIAEVLTGEQPVESDLTLEPRHRRTAASLTANPPAPDAP